MHVSDGSYIPVIDWEGQSPPCVWTSRAVARKSSAQRRKYVGRDGDGTGYVGPRGLPLTVADLGGSKCAGSKCAREPPFGFFNYS